MFLLAVILTGCDNRGNNIPQPPPYLVGGHGSIVIRNDMEKTISLDNRNIAPGECLKLSGALASPPFQIKEDGTVLEEIEENGTYVVSVDGEVRQVDKIDTSSCQITMYAID